MSSCQWAAIVSIRGYLPATEHHALTQVLTDAVCTLSNLITSPNATSGTVASMYSRTNLPATASRYQGQQAHIGSRNSMHAHMK